LAQQLPTRNRSIAAAAALLITPKRGEGGWTTLEIAACG